MNICDIIIKKIGEEWEQEMKKGGTVGKWEVPIYSKSQINKAGIVLSNPNSTEDERSEALKVVNNWRASHAYPLQVICSHLRRNNPNAIVVQRLKRLESITNKLERNSDHTMQLYRMHDLGGCRVIVNTIDEVYQAVERYKKSRVRHIYKRQYDYIQNPKRSGYRSFHMVYQFHSDSKATYNQNMLIEIQFRTKLQHIWATAVEMMGIYTKSNLKSSQGDEDVLRFFTLVSSVFSIIEKTPVCPDTSNDYDELVREIGEIDREHNIISALSGLSVAIDYVSDKNKNKYNKNGYYVLILDYQEKLVRVRPFKRSNIELATRIYDQIEKNVGDHKDAVLVSASSFETLKTAYPNYFTDISQFVAMMRKILK